ncbi:uromodulin-like 1 isoform X2 [Notolabrus celidotus]|uniref:uromodulin-like 1 isoform X2 n=1 Tax=Notolabrus celidotus TaxID=1203425 RepID=UPI00148FB83B|nr:uromodulin-like 1 isoform X2 [Notolabrus celidotus]
MRRGLMVHQTEYRTMTEEVTRCCDGYEQVGRYCALPVNRSEEFTTKPGSCPNADGSSPGSEACEWDIDCTGWQRCCHRLGSSLCSNPASPSNVSTTGGCRFNATVTVKTDYQPLMSNNGGHLNHLRLLQAMVTGALQADVSVYYLDSWPVYPFRTATSLLIECSSPLSLHNVTSKLHLLLAHIQEVSSVTVEDINECAQPALCRCSPNANCTNTEGSYHCTCLQGYTDVDPSDPGAHCRDVSESTTTEPPQTYLPPMNTTYTPASITTQDPLGKGITGVLMTTDLSNTSSVPSTTSLDPQWTSSAPYTTMRSTVESTQPTTTCAPPSITNLWSANVTGTSFSVSWSSQSQTNQTYQVVVIRGSEVVHFHGTSDTMMEVQGLYPGMLYNVTVTPCACGSQGGSFFISVKTDAQTLDATARLTNIQFTADLHNTNSQAYRSLTESLTEEIYQSLSAEMKAMVDSGQVRIEIRGFSQGSVVVNFNLIVTPSQSQDISNVSTAVLNSLLNSTKYTVDKNNTSITDFDECASGENDCSQWATCMNTWASYTCVCLDGFIDRNIERTGRACQAIPTMKVTTAPLKPTIISTVSTTPFSETTPTRDPALITVTTTPETTTVIISTSEAVTSSTPAQTIAADTPTALPVVIPTQPSTTITAATTTTVPTASTTITTLPATTIATTETITSESITTTSAPATTTPATTTTPVSTTTTLSPTTITSAFTTTTPVPTTTSPAPTSTSPAPAATTLEVTTTSPASTTTSPAPTTLTAAVTTSIPAPTTTIPASTTTSPAPTAITSAVTTSTPALTTTIPASTTTSTAPTTITSAVTTFTPAPTTTIPASTIPTSALKTTIPAPTTATRKPITTTPASSTTRTAPKRITLAATTKSDAQKTTTTLITTSPSVKTTTQIPKKPTTDQTKTTLAPKITKTSPKTTMRTTFSKTTPATKTAAPTSHTTAPRTSTNTSMLGAISVQCRVAAITVTVARDFLQSTNIKESALYLGLPECGVNGGNATHAELTVAWNECVTRLVHNETFYTASVTLFNSMEAYTSPSGEMEVPKIRLEVPIMCTYMKSMLISADFGSMGYDMIKDVITGLGSFQVTVQLMNGTLPLPHNYSMSSEEELVVEVSLNTSSEQIKVVINKCWATPSPYPGDTYSHTFLENSCSLNSYTKVLANGNSSTSRLSVKIFSFVNLNVIYLHCQVQICVQIGSDTCVPDCLQRTARSFNIIGGAVGSSGPVLRSDEDSLEDELNTLHIAGLACLGIGISLFFIIGFVCLFYYQRNRIGHYNFSVKPKQENFTYLVFNT